MKTMTIKIKKLAEGAKLPTYGSEYAAGADLYAYTETQAPIRIGPGETAVVPAMMMRFCGLVVCQSWL